MFRPPVNRAMRILDRSFFKKDVQLSAARVPDPKQLSRIRNELRESQDLLSMRLVMPIRPDPKDPQNQQKCILLGPGTVFDDRKTWSNKVTELHDAGKVALIPYLLRLEYDHWTAGEILSAVLPEELENDLPTGFNIAGHVAQFNLRDRFLPYKELIGQVTLDKNPTIKTVISKTDTLNSENEFRTLDFEVIAGEPDLNVEVRQDSSVFRFDYSKVYWNSKLGTEHQRVVARFRPGEAVCDVMAGVGPFAIPAGRKGTFVWANDLNPYCYSSLVDARKLNKTQPFVHAFNEDGHKFIKQAVQDLLHNEHVACVPMKISRQQAVEKKIPRSQQFTMTRAPRVFSHFVMNLPSIAIDFLPDFAGIYEGQEDLFVPHGPNNLSLIHCYCFGPRSDDGQQEDAVVRRLVWERISSQLDHRITESNTDAELYDVRDVAPHKRMFCATFRLPAEVAFRKQT